jgi:uncharacterized coiled-coil protein SlyX
MTADKPRINPIVAERDDMIGRSSTSTASLKKGSSGSDGNRSGGGSSNGSSNGSGGSNILVLIVLLGLIGAGLFGWMQFDALSKNHRDLQQRFEALETRLSSTDESVTQSGAAMQLKISKQADELKKHWSEIRKLWCVTNDINKAKIEGNKKDIAFLASKRTAIEKSVAELSARVDKENRSLTNLSGNYLAISADIDVVNASVRALSDKLAGLRSSLNAIDRQLKANAEGIESMDAFRRQTNQKIYTLEKRSSAPAPASNAVTPPSQ